MQYDFDGHAAIACGDSSWRVFADSRSAIPTHFILHHVQYCTSNGECLHECAHVSGAYWCVL